MLRVIETKAEQRDLSIGITVSITPKKGIPDINFSPYHIMNPHHAFVARINNPFSPSASILYSLN